MVQEGNHVLYFKVAVATQAGGSYTYKWHSYLAPGVRVCVPFGRSNRHAVGVVVEKCDDLDLEPTKVKSIENIFDQKAIYSKNMMELAVWIANYYRYPIGEVFRTMLPGGVSLVRKKQYCISSKAKQLLNEAPASREASILIQIFGKKTSLSSAVFESKIKKYKQNDEDFGTIYQELKLSGLWDVEEFSELKARTHASAASLPSQVAKPQHALQLTVDQSKVLQSLVKIGFSGVERQPSLLWGVTGAGKTEIYLQLIQEHFAHCVDAQILVMVPEISLTPQMTSVFTARFPSRVAVVHSAMPEAARWKELERIRRAEASILIGPRSAVFAPFAHLSLLIVDEEHDPSYKQTTGLCYNARDVAVVRAKLEQAQIVLGSATPSLESFYNTQLGKYELLRLSKRVHGKHLPQTQIVIPNVEKKKAIKLPKNAEQMAAHLPLSEKVLSALQATLARGEQAMVLVNRRGFAFYLFSLEKKQPVKCPHCSVSLTVHKMSNRLRCHYCDFYMSLSQAQRLHEGESLVAVGYGSEQTEEFLKQQLPDARIHRIDSDTVQKKDSLAEALSAFRSGNIDILVGTQILAKGHDFPKVTLICLLDIDQSLNLPDFRAGERTFQLMVQAAGRAGRSGLEAKVLVQCQKNDHPVLETALSQDYERFVFQELAYRKAHKYPPFSKMLVLEWNGPDRQKLDILTSKIREQVEIFFEETSPNNLSVLGPSSPPIEVIRGRHRRSLIIMSPSMSEARGLLEYLMKVLKSLPSGVRYKVDIDPQSML